MKRTGSVNDLQKALRTILHSMMRCQLKEITFNGHNCRGLIVVSVMTLQDSSSLTFRESQVGR